MTATEFFYACRSHDWMYRSSDDPYTYECGLANAKRLQEEAKTDSVKSAMYMRWYDYAWKQAKEPELSDFGLEPEFGEGERIRIRDGEFRVVPFGDGGNDD